MPFLPDKCRLPDILQKRHIEPVDFYTALGWSKQQYSAYVNNKKFMSAGTLKTVSHKLGLPMDDIYTWKCVDGKGERRLTE